MRCSSGLQIVVDGSPLVQVTKEGQTYVVVPDEMVRQQKKFQVVVSAAYRGWKLAVVSVDGLDVLTGKAASPDGGGYVFEGTELKIDGWRTDMAAVSAFEFTPREGAYASRIGEGGNVGVVGVVLWSETRDEPPSTFGTKGLRRGMAGHDVGTGFGERLERRVTETSFNRDRIIYKQVVQYASESSLIEAGILAKASPLGQVNAFPAARDERFCQPPTTR
jgi:hypothetical protein